ncbi:hypothetical protein BJ508DRAFT_312548 [Ascobolus immersus RN42]|uniref:Uncharacterized protein n=1 Tax=Ascobolus immersus RN42 TaxID=1160509 RepID=A0A3N4HP83_ASCIM|nr:hypothetical protein BJ508DRAFT_312548 [Ascobolus immersus RN42]
MFLKSIGMVNRHQLARSSRRLAHSSMFPASSSLSLRPSCRSLLFNTIYSGSKRSTAAPTTSEGYASISSIAITNAQNDFLEVDHLPRILDVDTQVSVIAKLPDPLLARPESDPEPLSQARRGCLDTMIITGWSMARADDVVKNAVGCEKSCDEAIGERGQLGFWRGMGRVGDAGAAGLKLSPADGVKFGFISGGPCMETSDGGDGLKFGVIQGLFGYRATGRSDVYTAPSPATCGLLLSIFRPRGPLHYQQQAIHRRHATTLSPAFHHPPVVLRPYEQNFPTYRIVSSLTDLLVLGAKVPLHAFLSKRFDDVEELERLYGRLVSLLPPITDLRRKDLYRQQENHDTEDDDWLVEGKHTARYLVGELAKGTTNMEVNEELLEAAVAVLKVPLAILLRSGMIVPH